MNILRKIKAKAQGRDIARIDRILDKLGAFWNKNYDLRLGQVLINLTKEINNNHPDIFYVEDEELEEAIEKALIKKKF